MEKTTLGTMDILQIMKSVPHRYPFLLIDKITDIDGDNSAVGLKNVTMNEWFFQGHFPEKPVMPGVLIVEAMAQTAAALVSPVVDGNAEDRLVYFMSVEGAKFRQPVLPGDQLRLFVTKERQRGPVWKYRGVAKVGENIVAEASFTAMIAYKNKDKDVT